MLLYSEPDYSTATFAKQTQFFIAFRTPISVLSLFGVSEPPFFVFMSGVNLDRGSFGVMSSSGGKDGGLGLAPTCALQPTCFVFDCGLDDCLLRIDFSLYHLGGLTYEIN